MSVKAILLLLAPFLSVVSRFTAAKPTRFGPWWSKSLAVTSSNFSNLHQPFPALIAATSLEVSAIRPSRECKDPRPRVVLP